MAEKQKETEVRTWPIRNTAKFLSEFEKVASKYQWFLSERKRGNKVFNEIIGVKGDNFTRQYSPLTAYVEATTGKFFDIDRFDLAASEVFMSAEVANQIVDSADDHPDRVSGYIPKGYEKALRKDLERICLVK